MYRLTHKILYVMCMYIYVIFPPNFTSQGKNWPLVDTIKPPGETALDGHHVVIAYSTRTFPSQKLHIFQISTAVHQFCTKSGTNVPQDSSVASSIMFTENQQVLFSGSYSVICQLVQTPETSSMHALQDDDSIYEGWNFNSGNYLFTTDTK